jgi:serine/threonine protein kinase
MKCPKCKADISEDSHFCSKCGTPLRDSADLSVSQTKTIQKPTISSGKTIARKYKIIEELGRGGMGVVYKAKDTRLDRTVALKFLSSELTQDKEAKQRFVQEAKAAAALNHPNISIIHEIDEHEGQTFIAMEYIQGHSLKQGLEDGPLEIDEAKDIALQVAEGLKEAHDKGIVHRDIKPANIMLTDKGQAKITDFGLAKLSGGADLTKASTIMGTVAYMSPEQAKGEAVDHRTDIWSLGAMIYEMLSGKKPFQKSQEHALIHAILDEKPESLSTVRRDIPRAIEQAVLKALEKELTRRYQNMAEFLKDIKTVEDTGVNVPKEHKSIIVLPFEDMSPGKDNEYFSDGLTEEIIADLSHIHDLLVISRSSAMTFKGTQKTIPEIAQAVNVRYVLEGSVRKAGNNLRITTQLIDSTNDAHLWAEKYSGTLDDVFDIQEKVSRSIVAGLKMRLAPAEESKISEHPVASASAYDCYLRAKHEIAKWTEPALDRALHLLETALKLTGDNAVLFAGLALVHITYAGGAFRTDEETLEKAERYANKALRLDPELAVGHYALAAVASWRGDCRQLFIDAKRAVSLDPNDPDAVMYFAFGAAYTGNSSTSRPFVERLLQVDPLNAQIHIISSIQEFYECRFEEALEAGRTAFELDPESIMSRYIYLASLIFTGRFDEARRISEQWREDMPGHPWVELILATLYSARGMKAESQKLLSEKTQHAMWGRDPAGILIVAEINALNGETEESLKWLEHAVYIGFINYPLFSELDPFLENIRGEPRFKKLMEQVRHEWENFEV